MISTNLLAPVLEDDLGTAVAMCVYTIYNELPDGEAVPGGLQDRSGLENQLASEAHLRGRS